MIDAADELRRFDLFDVEAYDEVLAQVNRDLTDGTIPPFEARIVWAESFGRRHRLVSFSSKSFRFGDAAALPIRFPLSVPDEYWYVASAAPIVRRSGGRALPSRAGCGEVRESIIAIRQLFAGRSGNLTIRRLRRTAPCGGVAGGQLRYTPQIALNTTPEQRTRYLKLQ